MNGGHADDTDEPGGATRGVGIKPAQRRPMRRPR
jgi:hypothetical protein